ncbi:MAG: hypothetical protein M1820_008306 [Bogoriella megaspora]|nr:MAG: hypothetical protein M1820_008306 [Bogoriella megaspora]
MRTSSSRCGILAAIAFSIASVSAQTYSNCNPLTSGGCPADSALGKTVNIDFTQGSSDSFTPQGNPTYDSNGASFTIAKSGDSPQLTSKWYIMFGHVEIVMKAAPGAGIVSSAVMQSDDLDEIDWEWLGAQPDQVQTNYFGKGQTTTYNRGAFSAVSGSQSDFHKYTIDWTSEQIVWQIDGNTVRTLTPDASQNQYPQTPMQIKVGAWAGGDPATNAAGTVQWAQGPVNWGSGPFTMVVSSIAVQDYSTGTSYSYSGTDGTWQSIQASGGSVSSDGTPNGIDSSAPAVTSSSSGQPMPFEGTHAESSTWTTPDSWPWVPSATTLATSPSATYSNYPGLPSGWSVSSSGKVIPPSSAPSPSPIPSSTSSPVVSAQASSSAAASPASSGSETVTSYDEKGFPTTATVPAGWNTAAKSYNDQGFLITPSPAIAPVESGPADANAQADASGANFAQTSSTSSAIKRETGAAPTMGLARGLGIAAALLGGAMIL